MKGRIFKTALIAGAFLAATTYPARAASQEAVTLSMDAAVEAALAADYGAERAEIETKIARERVRMAQTLLLPRFSVNATLETNRDPFFRTQLTQPLYNAENWQLVDQRHVEKERARVTEEDVRDRVALDAKRMYTNLLLEQKLQNIDLEHLAELQRIKEGIQDDERHAVDEKIIDGLIRKLENNIEKNNLSLQTQVRGFYFRLNREDCRRACPQYFLSERIDSDGLILTEDDVVRTALEYRTKEKEQNVRVYEENLQRVKAKRIPSLDGYVYLQESFANDNDYSTPSTWQAGVNGRWNFEWLELFGSPERSEARYELEKAKNLLAEHEKFVSFFSALSLEQYQTADQVINPSIAAGDKETYEQTFAEYFGETDRSFNDVNIALENAINSERQLMRDYANRLHRKIDLEYNMGLSEEGLRVLE